jgi:hypothetical protein
MIRTRPSIYAGSLDDPSACLRPDAGVAASNGLAKSLCRSGPAQASAAARAEARLTGLKRMGESRDRRLAVNLRRGASEMHGIQLVSFRASVVVSLNLPVLQERKDQRFVRDHHPDIVGGKGRRYKSGGAGLRFADVCGKGPMREGRLRSGA